MRGSTVLIIEDDPGIRESLATALRADGHAVIAVEDGRGIERHLVQADLAVIDLDLPAGPDGLELTRRIREQGELPVIILTAAGDLDHKGAGYRAGADQYVAKPFSTTELLWQIEALLRRAGRRSQTVQAGQVTVDPDAHLARYGDAELDLTPLEFSLLHTLARNTGRTLTKVQLLGLVWGHTGHDLNLVEFGTLLLALLGILLVGYDLRGRVAQGTALATPRRLQSYAAKLVVGGGIAVFFAGVMVPTCFIVTQRLLGETHAVTLSDTGVLRSLVGAFFAVVLVTLFAMALASTLRSTALTVAILMPLMFMISTILRNVPVEVISTMASFLPDQAGGRMAQAHTPSSATLTPYTAALVLAAWTVAALVAGAIRSVRAELAAE